MRTTSRWLMPILSLVLFFGAIGVAQAAGWWETSGRQAVAAGEMTVDDLKGWMTLQEAANGLGVPVDDLVAIVEAPAGEVVPETAFKDIEGLVPGFELTGYRVSVQAYLDERAGKAPAVVATTAPTTVPTGTPEEGLRGSMTIREVAKANGISVDRLLAECDLPADLDPDLVLREIRNVVDGFEIQTVRVAVESLSK